LPSRIPGAIQSFGFLVALRLEDAGCYPVRIVSENCLSICCYSPRELFALPTFQSVFPQDQQKAFVTYLQQIHDAFLRTGRSEEPKVSTFSFIDPKGNSTACCCATHFIGGAHNLFVCEFEHLKPQMDQDDDMPTEPVNTLGSQLSDPVPSESVLPRDSHSNLAQTLSEASGSIENSSLEVIAIVSQIHLRLATAQTVPALLDIVISILHDLTGFHRCMVYQFDHLYNGSVVSELIDPRASVDSYQGLHFPASDIPKQARDLVKIVFYSNSSNFG
jgi:light-regulated signal transduction histidine kinase (bacteriophytochrome)